MRSEHGRSYIESRAADETAAAVLGCDLCERERPTDVRTLQHERRAGASFANVRIQFFACLDCRMDLIHHLSARD